jgi:hypothetical protein
MSTIDSPYARISYEAPVVSFSLKEGVVIGFPEMHELIAHAETLSDKKPYVVFCDMRNKVQVTREGKRTAASKKHGPYKRGTALLVNPGELEHATKFFSGVKEPDCPFKAFTDEQQAIKWLRTLSLEE